jgi:hypothetical protein
MKPKRKIFSKPNLIEPKENEVLRVFNPLKLRIVKNDVQPKQ